MDIKSRLVPFIAEQRPPVKEHITPRGEKDNSLPLNLGVLLCGNLRALKAQLLIHCENSCLESHGMNYFQKDHLKCLSSVISVFSVDRQSAPMRHFTPHPSGRAAH